MTWVRGNWKVLLGITIVALVAIQLFEPDYNKLQRALDADAFRRILGDGKGGAIAANVSDFVFAAGYGVLGVLAAQRLGTGARAGFATALVAGGAVFDELENVLVFRNLVGAETTTDGWVDAMRLLGTAKLTLLYLALGALAGLLVLRVVRNRSSRAGS